VFLVAVKCELSDRQTDNSLYKLSVCAKKTTTVCNVALALRRAFIGFSFNYFAQIEAL